MVFLADYLNYVSTINKLLTLDVKYMENYHQLICLEIQQANTHWKILVMCMMIVSLFHIILLLFIQVLKMCLNCVYFCLFKGILNWFNYFKWHIILYKFLPLQMWKQ